MKSIIKIENKIPNLYYTQYKIKIRKKKEIISTLKFLISKNKIPL